MSLYRAVVLNIGIKLVGLEILMEPLWSFFVCNCKFKRKESPPKVAPIVAGFTTEEGLVSYFLILFDGFLHVNLGVFHK